MIFIVLGKFLNDDGTMTDLLIERLNIALDAYHKFHPEKIIVSGGIVNKEANVSEAKLMKDYLINKGIKENIIIEEGQSQTTKENALFSMPIVEQLNYKDVMIISSYEHFTVYFYNVLQYFIDASTKEHNYMIYTKH